MNKYTLTIEGDFEKGDCRKCPIGVASDILKGKGVIYSCMYALGGGSKEFCPLEEVKQGEIHKKVTEIYEAIELFEKSKEEDVFVFANAHKSYIARVMAELELMMEEMRVRCDISDGLYKVERMEAVERWYRK